YGNNVRGSITPAGTIALTDSSYYLSTIPSFWNTAGNFPSIGEPNVPGSGSIPAKERYLSGSNFTLCEEQLPTSLTDANNSSGHFEVYPNPASSVFMLNSNS